MNQEIKKLLNEKGILLEKELFQLLEKFNDVNQARIFLDVLERVSEQKIITTSSLTGLAEYVFNNTGCFSGEVKNLIETTLIKLGVGFEIQRTTEIENNDLNKNLISYRLFYTETKNNKKIEVNDFVNHFRSRYQQIQKILLQRRDVQDVISINKITKDRQRFSIIGLVSEKIITGNKNIIINFEDLTGSKKAFVRHESNCFAKVSELQLDDVVCVKVSGGTNDLLYIQDIIYPDSFKEKVKFESDFNIAFVSDIHVGSAKHLNKQFNKFIDWLNSDDSNARSIKYIFFVGDNVDGVGVFPGQERLLQLRSLKQQYGLLAEYLKRIPKNITMFMCPGQHDSVRIAEPQPIIDRFYGEALYNISNLVLVPNPTLVKLIEGEKEFKIQMYHGASIHYLINEIEELRLLKAHRCPARAVKYMLKHRHLAPSHSSVSYIPNSNFDPLVISEVPDILCTGEVHRLDIENYNGVLIITGSCWQSQTEFEERVGNVPDPCKVPLFNLKTREIKVIDFNDG